MIVTQERHLSPGAVDAFTRALRYSNLTAADVAEIVAGNGWMIWNCGGVSWVLTMANTDNEIEVLLAGGGKPRECIAAWHKAVLQEPAHRAMTLRIDGRKGWSRLFPPEWERRDDVLYLKVPDGQKENYIDANQ